MKKQVFALIAAAGVGVIALPAAAQERLGDQPGGHQAKRNDHAPDHAKAHGDAPHRSLQSAPDQRRSAPEHHQRAAVD
ncbi:hypothetical protein [Paraburkholderia sp. J67]|uniref:hypothetical protein n=1 Tax=Paraburkholderia sp. J67 TaxID=2805435 RepID=UPI002ABDFE8A|nr:hypothetical protein [Paraburkholderia sp. J67]